MKPFPRNFTAAASCLVLAALASVALLQPIHAAGSQDGSAGAPAMMDHTLPGHDQMPTGTGSAMPGHGHMDMSSADGRELVHFPPQMRTHMLGNMRDHVETLGGILHALAAADYDGAAKIAIEHLGLDSPSAAACKPKAANAAPPAPDSMDAMMALYMPEQMRAIGLAMHTSASEFAAVAARATATHDSKAAVEALSRVTQNCVACHAGYRLQ
jgi:cytochrome c556